MYVRLLNYMAENGITRSDIIVALGGGVTGDLAGFAAATYMRGIRYVQIPTTLLAMVDSSVGGKTAVDLPSGKNLAGAFWQPEMVLCDHSTLETLPRETFIDGCAEVVKYGILKDPEILSLVLEPERNIERIIEKCVTIKRDIVQEDERDNGKRTLLNLGHTAAHSIEKLSQ
jgi:3-dehydroquinate synthase